MRTRLFALGALAVLLSLAGCTEKKVEAATTTLPPVKVVQLPAASAGGACALWDYALIKKEIGVAFTAAASDHVDDTSTCVVQMTSSQWPYLVLSVVKSTKADADLFTGELMPAKATKMKGLGKAGYRLVTKASGSHGPVVEISWLSKAGQLQTLRYTFAKSAKTADVKALQGKLLNLAKALETSEG
ncbi:hypothetical protein GCM10010435_10220 [Winogradskya consettensis]|uniref:Uncharacterized protein n=1 Tax=Winogradskya consettensis TaxID=113560 RepID=A0A919SYJ3_9ACTN|nr:hypothetical protein Aco04nite_72940 [Actinoplanes consettensis]